jgi:cysteine desulfurase
VGALYVRHGTHILAQQQGGTQERHRRAGTENVAGAVRLAAAYRLSCAERPATIRHLRAQRIGWPPRSSRTRSPATGHPRSACPVCSGRGA